LSTTFKGQFAPEQALHVVRAERGYWAFVPPPLPPVCALDRTTMRLLSAADHTVGELAGASRVLPNPHLISSVVIRREAVLSSRIEGTQASLSDLVRYEATHAVEQDGDVREVSNYVLALQHVLGKDRDLPLSLRLLCEAHELLLTGVRGGYAAPGEFRRTQNWIGRPGCSLDQAGYVPPPPERLWECLGVFEKYLHTDQELPLLVGIALLHYQFEAIHPFVDGNGRVGRLLIVLLLVEWGLLPGPLLDISAYFEAHRDEYYAGLLHVSIRGDWTGWLRFFLTAVGEQATKAMRRALALQQLREEYRERLATVRSSGLPMRLADRLFETPAITIRATQELLGVTHRAALLNIEKLIRAGLLEEYHGLRRTRVFVATGILDVVDNP
jgi:Fic family protein